MTRWARRTSALAAAGLLAMGLAACQQPDQGQSPAPGDGDVTTLTPTDEPTDGDTTDGDTTDPTDPPSGPTDARVDAAVADLAERLDAAPDDVSAGPLEEVTWTDGSVGCPAPGQNYTQALVPGTRLILTVDSTEYAYHGKGEEALVYCETPVAPAPADNATA